MRHRIYREDNDGRSRRLPDGSLNREYYIDGESIGTAGIEKSAEPELRGRRGIQTHKLDTRETILTAAPERGSDVRLTIDAQLQARIQALFDPALGLSTVQPWHYSKRPDDQLPRGVPTIGDALAGAAVVLDVDTGDILALVTHPSFSHAAFREDYASLRDDKTFLPLLNRAVTQPYPPGSIVKPLVLCAAMTAGAARPETTIECTGHFLPDKPDILQCWAWKQFHTTHTVRLGHDPDGSDAIMGSCNIFFYELGRRLGPRGMVDWYTRYGVGTAAAPWRLGLDLEFTGLLPDPAKIGPTDAALMGIGQGPIAWTPLHAADAYATLARGGVRLPPRIRADAPSTPTDLALNQRAVEIALEGLRRACTEDQGTAHHITFHTDEGDRKEETFNVMADGIRVWAKSGTADASALLGDLDGDGKREIVRDGDHAWCVLLAGDGSAGVSGGRPRYAIAVVVDYGGSGGRVAGPIANQVIRALIGEGYLAGAPRVGEGVAAVAP
jgi:penicillin-binding protein 2